LTTPQSIAIAGIWIGVGLSAFGAGEGAAVVAIFAMFATIVIVAVTKGTK
jgi:hypothetical protein